MKGVKLFYTALACSLFFITPGCSPNADLLTTEKLLVRNVWAVDYYFNGQDMTTEFGNSRLLFSSTGTVGYQKDGSTVSGTWSRTMDQANNELINVHFTTADSSINKLNQAWQVTGRYANSLEFEASGANGTPEFRIKTQ